jgi:acetyl-CoA carboxylase carboxyltransferase component
VNYKSSPLFNRAERDNDFSTFFISGGPKGLERHVNKNKKVLVRDRIKMLIDPGTSFLEIGHFAGFDMMYGDVPCGGTVGGTYHLSQLYSCTL